MTSSSARHPWGKLSRRFCDAQVENGRLPEWQRIAFAAWARASVRGVAQFEPDELADLVARIDPHTGEVIPAKNVWRSIHTAQTHGWILPGSKPRTILVDEDVLCIGAYTDAGIQPPLPR